MMQAMPFRSSPRSVLSRVVSHFVVSPPRLMRLSPSFKDLASTPIDGRAPPAYRAEGPGARRRAILPLLSRPF